MKIHLIKERTIRNYALANPKSKIPLEEWLSKIKIASWNIPADINQTFGTADLLGQRSLRVVFNIGGNNYRMICKYAFGEDYIRLYVCWMGTHSGYNNLCNKNEQFNVFKY